MWNTLTEEQKIKFREYCDAKYGKTIVSVEGGEPLYFDEQNRLISTKIIIELLFCSQKN